MEALLSNQFVVLALDALLHIASVFVLGFIVIVACKLLSKGFVDAKLLTGLVIATLLVFTRVFLLNNAHRALEGLDIVIIMAVIGFIVFLTALVLVYKLISIPLLGTILSCIVIVAAQFALAHYTPILSKILMPEGQRFAEYAGVANERTKMLMAQAENFQGKEGNNIGKILKRALASIATLTSDEEQKTLSKDLSSGIKFIQERRAYTESMTQEEYLEYQRAMGGFLEEQGLGDLQDRYSLANLKNASPEDLENLANFMKDMNKEYGFTDDMPAGFDADDDAPPSLESIQRIAKNLSGIKIGGENSREFANLLKDITGSEEFEAEFAKVRGQMADLKANSGQLMDTFRAADLTGFQRELESATKPGSKKLRVLEDESDVFPASALSNSLTKDYVLRVPKSAEERSRWVKVARMIRIGKWFKGSGEQNKGTVFIDGVAYLAREVITFPHEGKQYHFRFEGVRQGQIIITALKSDPI